MSRERPEVIPRPIGIPYAPNFMRKDGSVYALCPDCDKEVPLGRMKDFESHCNQPYAEHWLSEHDTQEQGMEIG